MSLALVNCYELSALLLGALTAAAPLEAVVEAPAPDAPDDAAGERIVYAVCSAPAEGSATGRQWAQVVESPALPGLCVRELLGGEAPVEFPDCHELGLALGCREFGPDRP